MRNTIKRLWKEDGGGVLAEYGLIIALVSIAAVGALSILGGTLYNAFDAVADEVSNSTSVEKASE